MLKNIFMAAALIFLMACEKGPVEKPALAPAATDRSAAMDYVGAPDQNYSLIQDDLYKGDDGQLYLKALKAGEFIDGDLQHETIYVKRFGYYDSDVPNRKDPAVKDIVDLLSWRKIYDTIYGDENNIYCRHDLSSGARLYRLTGYSPDNARFIYVRSGVVANQFAFTVDPQSALPNIAWYITNGKTYYDYRCRRIGQDDLRTELKAQIALDPPDYSKEKGMTIKRR